MDQPREESIIEGFRLSPQQRRVWSLSVGSSGYCARSAVLLEGELDLRRLRHAIGRVVERHEILRTAFVLAPGAILPVQVVEGCRTSDLATVDLTAVRPDVDLLVDSILEAESSRPWSWEKPPLLRVSLLVLDRLTHVLLVLLPSLCADSCTLAALVEEVVSAYAADPEEEPFTCDPLQYADLAEWQNEALEAEESRAGRDFWESARCKGLLESALSGPRAGMESGDLATAPVWIDASAIVPDLNHLAESQGISRSAFLLACWQVFLWRLDGGSEPFIGVAFDGRGYEELRSAFGPFARYLPVPCRLAGGVRLSDLLRQTRDLLRELAEWMDYFSWSRLESGAGGPRWFRSGFTCEEIQPLRARAGLSFSILRQSARLERFDLHLACTLRNGGLRIELFYDPASNRDRGQAAGLMSRYSVLLHNALSDIEVSLGDLTILTREERTQLLRESHGGELPLPLEGTAVRLFEAQVRRTPGSIAILRGGHPWTYHELNAWANRLARALVRRGVDKEVLVGIWLERSLEALVSVLGIWKAGGAYLFLDPDLPPARRAQMLASGGAWLVLTRECWRGEIPSGLDALCLDGDEGGLAALPDEDLPPRSDSENLAYVVFTSGSTGHPKGIPAIHQGVMNYLAYLAASFPLASDDTVLQLPALSFDSALRDSIGPLTAGARVLLLSQHEVRSGATILARMEEHRPTAVLSIVPTLLREVLRAAEKSSWIGRGPRLLLASGERLESSDCLRVRRIFGSDVSIVNQYGPTECTMTSTFFRVGEISDPDGAVPIGRPIPNARVYLLDRFLQPALPGSPGEMCIGGPGVTRGYLGLPDLTARSFIPDPFSGQPGSRLYRTGDLARLLPDGNLGFLGRVDNQVKLRGLRIELEEIEAALRRHPEVRTCAVVLRETGTDEPQMVAYFVASGKTAPGAGDLRRALAGDLPDYMIPALFVALEALPTTPNGKIDRRALPEPDLGRNGDAEVFVSPRTPEEEIAADVWADILGRSQVGVHDNFFDLGGHSLLATRVVARLGELFRVALPLQAIFERPTVAGLATVIEEARNAASREALIIERVPPGAQVPLSLSQLRIWLLDRLQPDGSGWIIPTALRLLGPVQVSALCHSLREVVRRHGTLRTRFLEVDGEPVQVIEAKVELELPVIDLHALPPGVRDVEGRRILELEALRPLDLASAPLIRARLLRLADEEHWVCAALHHIIGDGWSMGVLSRELMALYAAFARRQSSPLAELPIQYVDFASWQRRRLQGKVLEELVSFWRRQLVPLPPRLDLPFDRVRAPRKGSQRSEALLDLSQGLSSTLRALGRREGATVFMVLVAAFKTLLYRYSDNSDIALGTPNANRSRLRTEEIIGNFADLIVLRSDLSGDPEFRELLARARRTALDALAHQDLPFAKMMEILRQEGLRDAPFQAMLALQSFPGPPPSTLDLTVERLVLARDEQVGRDVALTLRESGGRLIGSLTCNPALFERDTVLRWARHFETLLEDAAKGPERRLSELVLLTPAERQQLCREWPAQLHASSWGRSLAETTGRLAEEVDLAIADLAPTSPLYLLDRFLNAVPLGVEGEVFLAPRFLPSGGTAAFLGRAVPDPLASEPGGSLLRTGVRARWGRGGIVELALPAEFSPPAVADNMASVTALAGKTGAGVAERWDRVAQRGTRLSPGKQALLEKLLGGRKEGLEFAAAEPIPRRRDQGPAPLSFAQERMWFLSQLEPDSPAYNVPLALRLHGALSRRALEASLAELLRRHEVLRTRYAARDERPVQIVDPPGALSLPLVDIAALPRERQEETLVRLSQAAARLPFDLRQGPVLRTWLLRLGPEEHVFLAALHHIASDAASAGLFVQEMTALYAAFLAGRAADLPELPIQYADFATWQRQRLEGERLEAELAYWRERLGGASPFLDLPLDRPRPPIQSFHGDIRAFELPEELAQELAELGRGESATLFMVLLASFHALLQRCTGQDDICVGIPVSGRDRLETERLIGFFLNTLVIRADLAGDPSPRELLRQIRQRTLEAQTHQDLPFEKLVAELGVERSLSRSPLFQVMLSFQKRAAGQSPHLPGMTLQRLGTDSGTAKFDLTLAMGQRGERLVGGLEYNTDLFDETTALRLVERFRTLLEEMVLDPGRPLSDLPLLAASERQQLRLEWNDTRVDRAREILLHELFEVQAEEMKEGTALVWTGGEWSYAELDRRADALAARLESAGAGPDVVVGVFGERSPETLAGLLAILKTGGAILPLDPEYPAERLDFMLCDAGARVLLVPDHLRELLPSDGPAALVSLTPEDGEIGGTSNGRAIRRSPAISAEGLAYVIYTSGSTGWPKGIAMSHRALVSLMLWQLESRPAAPRTRTAQFAPLSFDVAFQEMFATWASGGTLVLVPQGARRDPEVLLDLLCRQRVERLYLPFVALQHLAEAAQRRADLPGSLREVFTAGEQLRITQQIRDLFARLDGCRLHNQYGPAESHVVSEHTLAGLPASWPELPPIGRPVANTRIAVLDRKLRPVPIGVAGELCISGAGLARGYLGRPELTAERFQPDPAPPRAPGDRLYRTGDLARLRADGSLEFLGRIDHQVKVRGFRIEPAEVEKTLARHPAVRQVAVVAYSAPAGDTRLAAYVVLEEGAGSSTESGGLRRFLAGKLPDYMMPSAFVVLERLPLTPSGKVDRRALPAPEADRSGLPRELVPPRNPAEERLVAIWAEVLGLPPERIGVHDSFFEIGGHSLLATRIVSRAQHVFQVELPLRRIFEAPTVAGLAAAVDAGPSAQPADMRKIADALSRIQDLSDEEVLTLLAQQAGREG